MRKTTAARNADAQAEKRDRLKALTDKLENGVKEVFESEAYKEYLKTMSKFHRYSFGNCMLIFFSVQVQQRSPATPHGKSWAARSKRASMEYRYSPLVRSRPWSSRTRWTTREISF